MTTPSDKTAMRVSFKDWAATHIQEGKRGEDQTFSWLESNEAA